MLPNATTASSTQTCARLLVRSLHTPLSIRPLMRPRPFNNASRLLDISPDIDTVHIPYAFRRLSSCPAPSEHSLTHSPLQDEGMITGSSCSPLDSNSRQHSGTMTPSSSLPHQPLEPKVTQDDFPRPFTSLFNLDDENNIHIESTNRPRLATSSSSSTSSTRQPRQPGQPRHPHQPSHRSSRPSSFPSSSSSRRRRPHLCSFVSNMMADPSASIASFEQGMRYSPETWILAIQLLVLRKNGDTPRLMLRLIRALLSSHDPTLAFSDNPLLLLHVILGLAYVGRADHAASMLLTHLYVPSASIPPPLSTEDINTPILAQCNLPAPLRPTRAPHLLRSSLFSSSLSTLSSSDNEDTLLDSIDDALEIPWSHSSSLPLRNDSTGPNQAHSLPDGASSFSPTSSLASSPLSSVAPPALPSYIIKRFHGFHPNPFVVPLAMCNPSSAPVVESLYFTRNPLHALTPQHIRRAIISLAHYHASPSTTNGSIAKLLPRSLPLLSKLNSSALVSSEGPQSADPLRPTPHSANLGTSSSSSLPSSPSSSTSQPMPSPQPHPLLSSRQVDTIVSNALHMFRSSHAAEQALNALDDVLHRMLYYSAASLAYYYKSDIKTLLQIDPDSLFAQMADEAQVEFEEVKETCGEKALPRPQQLPHAWFRSVAESVWGADVINTVNTPRDNRLSQSNLSKSPSPSPSLSFQTSTHTLDLGNYVTSSPLIFDVSSLVPLPSSMHINQDHPQVDSASSLSSLHSTLPVSLIPPSIFAACHQVHQQTVNPSLSQLTSIDADSVIDMPAGMFGLPSSRTIPVDALSSLHDKLEDPLSQLVQYMHGQHGHAAIYAARPRTSSASTSTTSSPLVDQSITQPHDDEACDVCPPTSVNPLIESAAATAEVLAPSSLSLLQQGMGLYPLERYPRSLSVPTSTSSFEILHSILDSKNKYSPFFLPSVPRSFVRDISELVSAFYEPLVAFVGVSTNICHPDASAPFGSQVVGADSSTGTAGVAIRRHTRTGSPTVRSTVVTALFSRALQLGYRPPEHICNGVLEVVAEAHHLPSFMHVLHLMLQRGFVQTPTSMKCFVRTISASMAGQPIPAILSQLIEGNIPLSSTIVTHLIRQLIPLGDLETALRLLLSLGEPYGGIRTFSHHPLTMVMFSCFHLPQFLLCACSSLHSFHLLLYLLCIPSLFSSRLIAFTIYYAP